MIVSPVILGTTVRPLPEEHPRAAAGAGITVMAEQEIPDNIGQNQV